MSTAFQLQQKNRVIIGKNQDIKYNGAYLFTNPRGVWKTALLLTQERPAVWRANYGSITLSQVGRELPNGGINEVGFVVEQTTLWETEYPLPDHRPSVGELQWIQILLDSCGTVKEALEATSQIRISQGTSKLHFLLADRSGAWAVIEFLEGEMIIHDGEKHPPILVNSLYKRGLESPNPKTQTTGYERNSLERMQKVMHQLKNLPIDKDPVAYTFGILQAVRREDTVYTVVYDLSSLELQFYTNRDTGIKRLSMNDVSFENSDPCLAADMQLLTEGSIHEQMFPYTTNFNRSAVQTFFKAPYLNSIFQWDVSDEMLAYLAKYPDSFLPDL